MESRDARLLITPYLRSHPDNPAREIINITDRALKKSGEGSISERVTE
jgi:hypothetical protein